MVTGMYRERDPETGRWGEFCQPPVAVPGRLHIGPRPPQLPAPQQFFPTAPSGAWCPPGRG